MDVIYLNQGDLAFPAGLRSYFADQAPERIAVLGNLDILKEKKTAFFCSSKCPGDLIIKTYDLAKKWRDDGITVIGGFHSPMEQECLTILLRGKQPVIVCPARSIENMRLKAEYKIPLGEGRLLILSPFAKKDRRVTSETSLARNYFVAALADEIFVTHAAPAARPSSSAGKCRNRAKRCAPLKAKQIPISIHSAEDSRPYPSLTISATHSMW